MIIISTTNVVNMLIIWIFIANNLLKKGFQIINLKSLIFDKAVTIDKIFLSDAFVNVKVNEKGEANYNVYISDNKEISKDTTSSTGIRLDKISIKNTHLVYDDKSTKILIDAKGFNYVGKGDLDKSIIN